MGKRLIIKGADFSTNRIPEQLTWFVDEYDQAVALGKTPNTNANYAAAGFAPNYDFGGKTINVLKFKVGAAGSFSIMLGNSRNDTNPTKVGEITVTSQEVGTVVTKQFDPITIPDGKYIWLGRSGDTGQFCYSSNTTLPGSTFGPMWIYLGTSSYRPDGNKNEILGVNFGFISQ